MPKYKSYITLFIIPIFLLIKLDKEKELIK